MRWGRLLHERFNNADAVKLFNEALQRDPKNAEAYLGLALVERRRLRQQGARVRRARPCELDPKLVEAHELLANLALEDSNPARGRRSRPTRRSQIAADALDAMAIHAAVELLADRSPGRVGPARCCRSIRPTARATR